MIMRPKQLVHLAAFLALLLGLALLDRGFARWRNDPRNFPNANGVYPTAEDVKPSARQYLSDPTVAKTMALSGASLLALSVVLFGIAPVDVNGLSRY